MAILIWVPPGSRRLRAEATAVGGRVDSDPPAEGAAERLDGAEADLARDHVDRQRAGLQSDPRALDAGGLDVDRGRHPGLVAKGAREVALAHAGAPRQRRYRQVLVEVVGNPL